ncbi:GNAT family N-acetyltransferase [Vibrio rhizosphaerae]|uniref:GNAT family N-acetyltransferase n=1 Tax=Vibrio rhizosphaerae TaxID=398736 RepID=A0ABU4IRT9_9VIBR|nr:GNAT family N-acetyltransferase [Vibrio rhizosphaerae]MDW6092122.1 GNAT family N-acetyltransferase [Vibrio rhizosphaerae]
MQPKKHITLMPVHPDALPAFRDQLKSAFSDAAAKEFGPHHGKPIPTTEDIWSSFQVANTAIYHLLYQGEPVGGAVLLLNEDTQHHSLEWFFIDLAYHNQGLGLAAWQAIEAAYPATQVWHTATPYFEKRNVSFYLNKCGFHITAFHNRYYPDTHFPADLSDYSPTDLYEYEYLLFEKAMTPQAD